MPDDIIRIMLHFSMIFISVTLCICLVRAIKGPTFADRIIAINMMCVKTILLIVIVGINLEEAFLVDVALVYALLSFVAVVVLTRIMLRSHFEKPRESDDGKRKEAPGEE